MLIVWHLGILGYIRNIAKILILAMISKIYMLLT